MINCLHCPKLSLQEILHHPMGHSMPTTPLEIRLLKLVEHPQQSAVIGQGILIQIML